MFFTGFSLLLSSFICCCWLVSDVKFYFCCSCCFLHNLFSCCLPALLPCPALTCPPSLSVYALNFSPCLLLIVLSMCCLPACLQLFLSCTISPIISAKSQLGMACLYYSHVQVLRLWFFCAPSPPAFCAYNMYGCVYLHMHAYIHTYRNLGRV